jgi:hypothetical protein
VLPAELNSEPPVAAYLYFRLISEDLVDPCNALFNGEVVLLFGILSPLKKKTKDAF